MTAEELAAMQSAPSGLDMTECTETDDDRRINREYERELRKSLRELDRDMWSWQH